MVKRAQVKIIILIFLLILILFIVYLGFQITGNATKEENYLPNIKLSSPSFSELYEKDYIEYCKKTEEYRFTFYLPIELNFQNRIDPTCYLHIKNGEDTNWDIVQIYFLSSSTDLKYNFNIAKSNLVKVCCIERGKSIEVCSEPVLIPSCKEM